MNKIPQSCEVLIVGGGPAGTIAASWLAQQNIDVVLFEKNKFPIYKVGESLIPHFWKYTDLIGASEKINNAGFIKKAGGIVHWNGSIRKVSFKDFGFTKPALHVERDLFDSILLDHAQEKGAKVYQETLATKIITHHDHVEVIYTTVDNESKSIKANYIIDASGQDYLLAKQNNWLKYEDQYRFQAFWAYFDQTDYLNQFGARKPFSDRRNDAPVTLISSTEDWGWTWHIVLQENVSVGAIIPQSQMSYFKNLGDNLSDRFLKHIQQTAITKDMIKDGNIISEIRSVKDYTSRSKIVAMHRIFIAGDAAAFFDPINSEGLTMAMYSSYLAAWSILQSIKKPNRALHYMNTYIQNLELRLSLFQLLTVPSHEIPDHLIDSIKKNIRNQSITENLLTLTQLLLTNRSNDFGELLEKLGIRVPFEVLEFELEENYL